MAWIKLESRYARHPKLLQVSPLAGWLDVCGLCWTAEYLTDGLIPEATVPLLDPRLETPYLLAAQLVEAGRWEKRPDGYRVHDYLRYNPSRAETMHMRRVRASSGRVGGRRSAEVRENTREAIQANGQAKLKPVSVSVSVSQRTPPRSDGPPTGEWSEELQEIRAFLDRHRVPAQLYDPVYWARVDSWLGGPSTGVAYLDELLKYLAWVESKTPGQRHKNLKAGFRNWLAKSEYWSHSRAQTQAFRDRPRP
jgi:hypothetical protein